MSEPAGLPPHAASDRVPTTRRVMTPQDTNLMGTVFGGAILSEIDLAAAIEAHRVHSGNVVTVAMDKVEFKRPIFVGDLVSFFTHRVAIGRTSITVRVEVWAERRLPPHEVVHVTEALVTMVAVDADHHAIPLQAS
jgi:acyl-CoA thioesterase YciA